MLYLKIKVNKKDTVRKQKRSIFEKLLSFLIPKANPDFEDKMHKVSDWLLEFENENSKPNREIGLDVSRKVILKMPYQKNYGYWTDNNLNYKDFKENFDNETIEKKDFEKYWSKLNKR